MFSLVSGSLHDSPDVKNFISQINAATDFFDPEREIFGARAPGRLDLMGGIADYSGSMVLQYPIREATLAAVQIDSAPRIRVRSRNAEREVEFEITLADLFGKLSGFAEARQFFRQNADHRWAAYVIGVFLVLSSAAGVEFSHGARILINSEVPEGKGVSSSAALEVAAMRAVGAAFGLKLEARELALLCQKTENEIVGAPCGVMDQMVSACGEENKLLALVCQPAELKGTIALPAEVEIWGIDSGIRHSVAGADYGSVRAGAFIGYRLIAELAGLKVEKLETGFVQIVDEKWRGYLANLSPEEFESKFRPFLPEKISGREFLEKFHGTTDRNSRILPEKEYAVLAPTEHPVYENFRVGRFAQLFEASIDEANFNELGRLMYQSHASYTACGLGSEGTDLLVETVKKFGPESGLYGAKITGGGSGGTVAVLGRRGSRSAVEAVAENYEKISGHRPQIFSGSSPGAHRFGVLTLNSKEKL